MNVLAFFVIVLCFISASNALWGKRRQDTPAAAEIDDDCIELAQTGSCHMYDCMQERHRCDVLVNSAKPSCVDMESKRDQFNQQGKQWLNATRLCLHEALIMEYEKEGQNCDTLKETIRKKSSNCALNVQPNICDIFESNTAVLVSSQNSDLGDSTAVLRQCGWRILRAYFAYSTS